MAKKYLVINVIINLAFFLSACSERAYQEGSWKSLWANEDYTSIWKSWSEIKPEMDSYFTSYERVEEILGKPKNGDIGSNQDKRILKYRMRKVKAHGLFSSGFYLRLDVNKTGGYEVNLYPE